MMFVKETTSASQSKFLEKEEKFRFTDGDERD